MVKIQKRIDMDKHVIPEFPAYAIDREGNVYSRFKPKTSIITNEWRKLTSIICSGTGYYLVTLCDGKGKRKNKRVHRLLMEAFVPNPHSYPHINHIDGDKLNNSLDNLEWCTCAHNSKHASMMGLIESRTAKLRVPVLQFTKEGEFIAEHRSMKDAERATGVQSTNIHKVAKGIRPYAGG